MTPGTRRLDRGVVGLLGLLLLAAGGLTIAWLTRVLDTGEWVDTSPVAGLQDERWWVGLLVALGLILLLLGAGWLFSHTPRATPNEIRLPGSGKGGRSSAALGPVLSAAGDVLEQSPYVDSVSTSKRENKGRLSIVFDVTMHADAPLDEVGRLVDAHLDEVNSVIGRSDFEYIAKISVADLRSTSGRVH